MPNSTYLNIPSPAPSDYVTNGAVAMTALANGIDGYFGPPTTYTPTLTNVTTGTVTGRYTRFGKVGLISLGFSAGTATAAGVVTATLPAGWTTIAIRQVIPAQNGAALASVEAGASGTVITIRADSAGTNFTLGASLTGIRLNGWLYLA